MEAVNKIHFRLRCPMSTAFPDALCVGVIAQRAPRKLKLLIQLYSALLSQGWLYLLYMELYKAIWCVLDLLAVPIKRSISTCLSWVIQSRQPGIRLNIEEFLP